MDEDTTLGLVTVEIDKAVSDVARLQALLWVGQQLLQVALSFVIGMMA